MHGSIVFNINFKQLELYWYCSCINIMLILSKLYWYHIFHPIPTAISFYFRLYRSSLTFILLLALHLKIMHCNSILVNYNCCPALIRFIVLTPFANLVPICSDDVSPLIMIPVTCTCKSLFFFHYSLAHIVQSFTSDSPLSTFGFCQHEINLPTKRPHPQSVSYQQLASTRQQTNTGPEEQGPTEESKYNLM